MKTGILLTKKCVDLPSPQKALNGLPLCETVSDWATVFFYSPAWEHWRSIHLPKDSLSLQLFLGFLPGQKLFERFYHHSFFIPRHCSCGYIFVSVLQRCIWFSTQAYEEVISSDGFPFSFWKRRACTWVSLKAKEEGSYKYCDNSKNKLVRRGFASSER